MAAELLEVQNLSVGIKRGSRYYSAVKGIDLTIHAGEITALIGESGCGKTITCLSVMRLLPPAADISGGRILYHSGSGGVLDLCSAGEETLCRLRGKDIAMVFQEPLQSLNPLMRIGAQIAEAPELHGTGKKAADKAALDMLEQLKFPQPRKILGAWPHQLSGGMCQRVMIAIAAINRPRLLVADEATSALDAENQNRILALLEQVNREFGTAVLFISHDLSLARRFSSRTLVMYAGNVIEEVPSRSLFTEAPLHPYTRALAGAVPRRENKGRPLANIPGKAPSVEEAVSGCAFAPRCPRIKSKKERERCTAEFPLLTDIGSGRKVRCFFPGGADG